MFITLDVMNCCHYKSPKFASNEVLNEIFAYIEGGKWRSPKVNMNIRNIAVVLKLSCISVLLFSINMTFYGQSVHHQGISSSGANAIKNSSVVQSIGVPITGLTHSFNSLKVTQGFVHPISILSFEKWASKNIKVFPNPFINSIEIALPNMYQDIKLTLFDLSGRLKYEGTFKNSTKLRLNFSDIDSTNGIHILRIQADLDFFVVKLIRL